MLKAKEKLQSPSLHIAEGRRGGSRCSSLESLDGLVSASRRLGCRKLQPTRPPSLLLTRGLSTALLPVHPRGASFLREDVPEMPRRPATRTGFIAEIKRGVSLVPLWRPTLRLGILAILRHILHVLWWRPGAGRGCWAESFVLQRLLPTAPFAALSSFSQRPSVPSDDTGCFT